MSRLIRVVTPAALAVGALALAGCSKAPATTTASTSRAPITAAGTPTTKAGTPTTAKGPTTTAVRKQLATPECASYRLLGTTQLAVSAAKTPAEKNTKFEAVQAQAADLSTKVPSLKADVDLIVQDVKDYSVDGKPYSDPAKDAHKEVQGRLTTWYNANCYE